MKYFAILALLIIVSYAKKEMLIALLMLIMNKDMEFFQKYVDSLAGAQDGAQT